ncbi:dihydrolipoamide acetyltransferase component of pyruvate dehydrogenase complex [Caldovatus sediminis]|uniref:Dihydrolipoamide acetyltransferase component of pyruvate dehydrogenase complex n=1 Tax=Caldovatus sediminis TaxID=2041189 RepID=A0A8J2ZCK5_9PROT|nr:dihydrolipoamide acetyltransferase family protein [Caldovatus sediminis]GGG40944.1 dihydrolipoamide acetyltransferase component of pyruvate dehydrogenase complex [Caldovatus sediminis]
MAAPLAEIVMPKLGLTMAEGLLAEWRVAPGARVAAGDVLFVVETEKIATEVEAAGPGEIREILVPAGRTVPVGTPVARWTGAAPASAAPGPAAAADRRIVATPLARRLARERGVALSTLAGSGPRGRIRAKDVPATAAPAPAPDDATRGAAIPLDRVRAAAARRLTQAKREIPHFYVGAAAEVSRLLALREEWRELPGAPRLTVTHFVLAAVGRALLAMPELNRVWEGEGWRRLSSPDVGIAVDTPHGLLAPVLRDAGHLPLDALARRADALIGRARDGRLAPDDLQGGCITLSNVGMHGVRFLVPIVNPGQSMILGLGAAESVFRPDAHGAPALRREVTLVLAADHRVLDGAAAAAFLARVVAILEKPLALLLAPAATGSP